MKRKMPKVLLALALVCVLTIGTAAAAFAANVLEDTDYGDGQVVDGSTGWNTADGDNYLVTEAGTMVKFTNNPFVRDSEVWSNFIVETVASDEADGLTMRADAWYWTYTAVADTPVNTPWANIGYNFDMEDLVLICEDYTEITLIAYQYSETLVIFSIEFGDSGYYLNYYAFYEEGVPSELWFHVGADGGTVTINSVLYMHEVESVEIVSLSQDEFFYEESLDFTGTELKVTYDDGSTAIVVIDGSGYAYDAYDNGFMCYIYQYIDEYSWYSYLPGWDIYATGTYTVAIQTFNRDGEFQWDVDSDLTVNVRYFTVDDIDTVTELELNEIYESNIDVEGTWVWYSYTPEVSGYYEFRSFDNEIDPYVELYTEENGELNLYDDNDDGAGDYNFLLRTYLEEGVTYYYKTRAYSDYTVGIFYVELSETVYITDISVSALSQTELTQYVTEFDLTGTVVTVTYSDGTSAELVVDGYSAIDGYGNSIRYYLIAEVEYDGDTYSDYYSYGYRVYAMPGTYTVYIYDSLTGITDESQTIAVESIEDSDEILVLAYLDEKYEVADAESGEYVWFSYTPVKASEYYFVMEYTQAAEIPESAENYSYLDYDVWYIDENGNFTYVDPEYDEETWAYLYDETGENCLYALTEGVTYYVRAYYFGGYEIWGEDVEYEYHNDIPADLTVMVCENGHTHTYTAENIVWAWSEDHLSATATISCDGCGEALTSTATVTTETTEATATTDGSIVYTATVTLNGTVYTNIYTETIPATGEDATTADPEESSTTAESEESSTTAADDSTTANTDSTGSTSPKTGDVATWGYYVMLLGAVAAAVVFARKKVNA